jgi:TfdA family taurine catabolism dioxygenase TauD
MAYRSFGEQALTYFDRPHADVRREPLTGPAAWRGRDLARSSEWIVPLDETALAEIARALGAARATGKALGDLTRDDFPLPALAPTVGAWARELVDGRGFLLVRGLPVERWSEADAALVFWCLGLHLGVPGAQNPQGDLLGHVVDTGEQRDLPNVRLYRTNADIAFHCDLADAVGLLCLRTARSGGASRIASSVTVYNTILARRPDLVERLYEPLALDTRDESGGTRWVPVHPCRFDGRRLRTFFHSDYFRSTVRHPDVPPLDAATRELLDVYDAIANSPEVRLDMQFEPGDVQLLSNHTIVHARTAYADDPAAPRHLLRLWLSLARG